ncbi:MAG: response regulator transcription factor [Sphingobium sp.]
MKESRIMLVDDHPLIREGLQMALRNRHPGRHVDVAEDVSTAEILARQQKSYQLLILDWDLPDSSGFTGYFRMRQALSDTPIAILSADSNPSIMDAAKAVGAAGFLPKTLRLDELMRNIDNLLAGFLAFQNDTAASSGLARLKERVETLSSAQMRVLMALANGQLNKQIADDLGLAEATVKTHMTAIFRKLGVNNRLQAHIAIRPLLNPAAPD